MKKAMLAVAVIAALGLQACSSTKLIGKPDNPDTQPVARPSDSRAALKDTRISTEFRDEGVKLFFLADGTLERLEVIGTAPSWKGNVDVLAEMDAMDKLVKFVHGQTTTSDRKVRIMTRAIDRARDATMNRIASTEQTQNFTAEELESSSPGPSEARSQDNTSRRNASRLENTVIETVQSITAGGRLTGVRKIGDRVVDDGRTYVAIFQWSERDQATSEFIRSRMR